LSSKKIKNPSIGSQDPNPPRDESPSLSNYSLGATHADQGVHEFILDAFVTEKHSFITKEPSGRIVS
jgi:hypothetical protein